MTSQCGQRLLPGEKELGDRLRPLVQPLRKQYDTKEEQAVCLQELGELYLKAGVEFKNGKDFTKAAALFSAALVRTSKEEIQKKMKGHLVEVRQAFMVAFYPDAELIPQEQLEEIRMQNIHTLEKMRSDIKENSRSLEILMDRYDIKATDILEMETSIVSEAKNLTMLVQEEILGFIKLMWNQSMEFSNVNPPCKYSMMGLGSLARQELTPYSDLEFAILVERKSDDVQGYFENLTNLFHLSVLDLGETPIPQMAIPSLNDFITPGGDWFYDKITPSGFKLDGEMPWACKTPTGRQATCNQSSLSFIKTPVELAELLKDDSLLGQHYRVADVLRRTIHIIGDLDLYDIYQRKVLKIAHESDTNLLTSKGISALTDDISESYTQETPYHNAKLSYYRLPSTFVENMRQWLTPTFQGGSQWCIIEHLIKMQKLTKEDAFELEVIIALAYGVRLLTYFTNRGQREKIKTRQFYRDPGMKSIEFKIRIRFEVVIRRTLFTNFGEDISSQFLEVMTTPSYNKQKQCPSLHNSNVDSGADSMSQIVQLFEDSVRSVDKNYPPILKCYCNFYFVLARGDRVIPELCCGDTCQVKKIYHLESGRPNLDNLDFLLKNTHLCVCVSKIKNYLKVHRYCTRRFLELSTSPPDVYLNYFFDQLSKCTEERDILFLNFNLLKLAFFSTDVTVLKRVAKTVEEFLDIVVPKMSKRKFLKKIFHHMEFDFYRWLMLIYDFLGEFVKSTNLLERWVDVLEKYHPDGEFDIEHIDVYMELGKALLRNPKKEEEAIHLYKKAFQRLENEITRDHSIHSYQLNEIFTSIYTFAQMLSCKKRFEESEALLKEYFLNDRNSFDFTNEQIILALNLLAVYFRHSKKYMQYIEVCEKMYRVIKVVCIADNLSPRSRIEMADHLIIAYSHCMKIVDLPKAAECHKLACDMQNDNELAVSEHRFFLLISAMYLFSTQFTFLGIHYLALDQIDHKKKIDFRKTDMWLHTLVGICDAMNIFISFRDTDFLIYFYEYIAFLLSMLSEMYNTRLDLYQIYVEYRLCHFLFSIAMDPEKSFVLELKETTDYIYQTQTRLTKSFPKCATAVKWCQDARFNLNPNAEDLTLQGYIKPFSLCCMVRTEAYKKRFCHM